MTETRRSDGNIGKDSEKLQWLHFLKKVKKILTRSVHYVETNKTNDTPMPARSVMAECFLECLSTRLGRFAKAARWRRGQRQQ
jgi:hypothetical protein